MGDWATRAGDLAAARTSFRTACLTNLGGARPEEELTEYSCERALALGEVRAALLAAAAAPAACPTCRQQRRVSGETHVPPPRGEWTKMCELGMKRVTAKVVLCLSDRGIPRRIYFATYSGARRWDQRLYEAMRAWRYDPFIGPDGKAPGCR